MGEVEGKVNGHGQEPQAIVPSTQGGIEVVGAQTVEQMLAAAEKQVQFRKGIVKLIAVHLDPSDVALYGEGEKQTIHLTKHACKQILSWAGITVQPDSGMLEKKYDGVEGPYIDFEMWGTWIRGTQAFRTMGNRSTYDDFFAKRTKWTCECGSDIRWENRKAICLAAGHVGKAEKTTYYLPLSEVDIPSVKQAAITNFWNHIVEDAGLKPSKKELAAVGFKFDEAGANVKFGNSGAEAGAPKSQPGGKGSGFPKAPVAQPAGAAAKPQEATTAAPSSVPKAQIPREPGDDTPQNPPEKKTINPDPRIPGVGQFAVMNGKVIKTGKKKTAKNTEFAWVEMEPCAKEFTAPVLFCFHNKEMQTSTGPMNSLDILKGATAAMCSFTVKANAPKGDKGVMLTIEGMSRVGDFEWDTDGTPITRRDAGGYEPTDEDIPF